MTREPEGAPLGPNGRRILLVRHGESTANVAAAAAEHAGLEVIDVQARDADVELSELGGKQAATVGAALSERLGADWAEISQVWSSPYRRAIQTCTLAAGGGERVLVDERLRDRELGIIDALTARGVEARLPQEAARRRWLGKFYYRPPGGESWADVALRVRSFLRDVEADDSGPLVLFTHDAVVSLFAYVLLRLDETGLAQFLTQRVVANASITSFRAGVGGRWALESFADASHVLDAGVPATEHTGTGADGS